MNPDSQTSNNILSISSISNQDNSNQPDDTLIFEEKRDINTHIDATTNVIHTVIDDQRSANSSVIEDVTHNNTPPAQYTTNMTNPPANGHYWRLVPTTNYFPQQATRVYHQSSNSPIYEVQQQPTNASEVPPYVSSGVSSYHHQQQHDTNQVATYENNFNYQQNMNYPPG